MKRPFSLLLISVAILVQGCQDDFENQTLEKINFTFSLDSGDISGGRSTSDLPSGTSLLLTLNDNNGKPVLTNHKIEILRLGEGYIDEVIKNVYNNTIAKEIDQGVFLPDNSHDTQPSSASIEKLNFLSENYRWKVTYLSN